MRGLVLSADCAHAVRASGEILMQTAALQCAGNKITVATITTTGAIDAATLSATALVEDKMHCVNCGALNVPYALDCASCGRGLISQCPKCSQMLAPGAVDCPSCGHTQFDAGVSGRHASPAAYTPRHLAAKILSSRAVMEGERKQVTVMFCDIVESTALARRVGPEAMHAILSTFFDRILVQVHRFEGTLNQFRGDGFMALFGAPIAHEDHARRALQAALAVRDECHADRYRSDLGRLPLRIGLNTGQVVVGKIGDNLRMDYTAYGDTTHVASRMESLAAAGEVLVAEATHAVAAPHFLFESLGKRRLKGIADPIEVYRLLSQRSGRDPAGSASRGRTPLVGRETQLERLDVFARQLVAGKGGLIGLIGEPGSGKTRLLTEFRDRVPRSVHWLEGTALSFGHSVSYGPIIEVIRDAVGMDDRDLGLDALAKLELFLESRLPVNLTPHLPFIGILLGLELPAVAKALALRLDPKDVRGQIFMAVRRMIEVMTASRPVILALEDWHWADSASQELLEHLLDLTAHTRLLICFTGRPDPQAPSARLREIAAQEHFDRYLELLVGPLSNSDANKMVEGLLRLEHLPNALRGLILRKAEGNPLFMEEIAHSLYESGAIREDPADGSPVLTRDFDSIDLPDRVETLIMARIDRLEGDVKQVLRLASVIGRSFYPRILQILGEAESELNGKLAQLQSQELIRKLQQQPEVEYVFKHALVQEASYRSLLEDMRRRLHHQVGEAIETMFPDRITEFAAVLAHHFVTAQSWEKAHRYLLLAGDLAGRVSADTEAVALYRRAVDSYGRAFGERWDPIERASIERRIGQALLRLGSGEEATAHMERALELIGYTPPRSRVGIHLQLARQLVVQCWHLLRKPGVRRPRPGSEGAAIERVQSIVALSWADFFGNENRFALDALLVLNTSESHDGLEETLSLGCMGFGLVLDALGMRKAAGHYHRRAMAIAESQSDSGATATTRLGFGAHLFLLGDWPQAAQALRRAVQEFERAGALREGGFAAGFLCWVLIQMGELSEAGAIARKTDALLKQSGDHAIRAHGTAILALLRGFEGNLEQAAAGIEAAFLELRSMSDWHGLVGLMGGAMQVAAWRNDRAAMARYVTEVEQIARVQHLLPSEWFGFAVSEAWDDMHQYLDAQRAAKPVNGARLRAAGRRLRSLARKCPAALPLSLCFERCTRALKTDARQIDDGMLAALAGARQMGTRFWLPMMQQMIARVLYSRDMMTEALVHFRDAGVWIEVVRSHRFLGEMCARESLTDLAREHFRKALELLAPMQADEELRRVTIAMERSTRSAA